ncbi:hypothetical protein DOTSEDRAFT_71112 [Dothistroma septosporum NZE10]|uniref:Pyruvate decarboxylase n=1 Tax=Dothistroma septosporum (strain NZE10 / CBS 128990) TaxID=675120 RepID=N1PPI5_DOTSN|nr:hypothetical protein DOTSEDRAFT_71112 [Dothistroma septosporum NZE10]
MSDTITLAEYLFERLKQLGVATVHGVPGDYNLTLLDYVEPSGLHWTGGCNELNAGYATDGYSRIKGVGALITTFGVGELSAINAIAGAYAELAKVVHIVGTPRRDQQESRALIHHTLLDGDYTHFADMSKHVTVAQANLLDPRTATQLVDNVLLQCLIHSRPVYIQLPVDMVSAKVSAKGLSIPLDRPQLIASPDEDAATCQIVDRINHSKRPVIMVDGESVSYDMMSELQGLIKTSNWPTWMSTYAKGSVDEDLPNVHGVWAGPFASQAEQEYIKSADLILWFGPHHSNTNTFLYSTITGADKTIYFKAKSVLIGGKVFRDLPAKQYLASLLTKLDSTAWRTSSEAHFTPPPPKALQALPSDEAISQASFYRKFATWLRLGDILLAETGTPGYGCRDMRLPANARLFNPVTWLSIGYMLPACQGAALAQRELHTSGKWQDAGNGQAPRTILMQGDGSFQMTAQELSTIIKEKLNVLLVLINNDGYTIERCIHGWDQEYNDVARWRYLEAPSLFGAAMGDETGNGYRARTYRARTWGELETAMSAVDAVRQPTLHMVEVIMDREDAPDILAKMLRDQKVAEQKGVKQ